MMEKNFKIYLFRHGETVFNKKKIFTGQHESKLTKKGIKQAKKIAKLLKNKKIDVAFYTGQKRSKETLKYILKFHPECKEIIKDERMNERSYGDLEGMSHKEFIKKIGEEAYKLRAENKEFKNLKPSLREKIKKFLGVEEFKAIHRGYNVATPHGESFKDVEKRVRSFIRYLKKFIKKNKVNVAISAHGNSIRVFRKIMENSSEDQASKWNIPYDKVFEYTIKE